MPGVPLPHYEADLDSTGIRHQETTPKSHREGKRMKDEERVYGTEYWLHKTTRMEHLREFMRRAAGYVTGALAVLMITFVIGLSIKMVFERPALLTQMASGVINGVGIAIGTLLGGAVVLRFKTARKFIRRVISAEADQ